MALLERERLPCRFPVSVQKRRPFRPRLRPLPRSHARLGGSGDAGKAPKFRGLVEELYDIFVPATLVLVGRDRRAAAHRPSPRSAARDLARLGIDGGVELGRLSCGQAVRLAVLDSLNGVPARIAPMRNRTCSHGSAARMPWSSSTVAWLPCTTACRPTSTPSIRSGGDLRHAEPRVGRAPGRWPPRPPARRSSRPGRRPRRRRRG